MARDGEQRVVVIGGGLAGLAAATYLGRGGARVTLCEGAGHLGGRAASQRRGGYTFNLGAHALYRGGRGVQVLRELSVRFTGGVPPTAGLAVRDGRLEVLPGGPGSLLRTRLLPLGAKVEFARLAAGLRRRHLGALAVMTIEEWLAREVRHPALREFVAAALRLVTYADEPGRQSVGDAIAQFLRGTKGVYYLDGGWQTTVDGLREAALAAGVEILEGATVVGVEHHERVHGVRLADGSRREAEAVVLAVAPRAAAELVPSVQSLSTWAASAVPARAACLDVALARLPRPRRTFALGIDLPMYLSVISARARVAPPGGALIQTVRYLRADHGADARATERELEGLLDLVQPGWRDSVVERRFLPNLTVTSRLPLASEGGCAGRPGPAVPDVAGLYAAGDWVGSEGMLADAALWSARTAAGMIVGEHAAARERAAHGAARAAA